MRYIWFFVVARFHSKNSSSNELWSKTPFPRRSAQAHMLVSPLAPLCSRVTFCILQFDIHRHGGQYSFHLAQTLSMLLNYFQCDPKVWKAKHDTKMLIETNQVFQVALKWEFWNFLLTIPVRSPSFVIQIKMISKRFRSFRDLQIHLTCQITVNGYRFRFSKHQTHFFEISDFCTTSYSLVV